MLQSSSSGTNTITLPSPPPTRKWTRAKNENKITIIRNKRIIFHQIHYTNTSKRFKKYPTEKERRKTPRTLPPFYFSTFDFKRVRDAVCIVFVCRVLHSQHPSFNSFQWAPSWIFCCWFIIIFLFFLFLSFFPFFFAPCIQFSHVERTRQLLFPHFQYFIRL